MSNLEVATLGSGCYWCSEAVYSELVGVVEVEPGYSGGTIANPSYEQVCTGETGHAEVAQVTFDPTVLSYPDLLKVFFSTHDPTTPNRQGADEGSQYRSAVFYHSEDQKRVAEEMVKELTAEKVFRSPIVTQILPFAAFYPAEDYHRQYFARNPNKPYCQVVIAPKLAKFRSKYKARLKKPQTVSP